MKSTNRILNLDIHSISLNYLLENYREGVLFTPNVDHIVKLQKDPEFYNIYRQADWIVCDSNILNLASRFLHEAFKEVIPGSSFLPAFYRFHGNNPSIKIFLLGAAEGVAVKAMKLINEKIGREIVVAAHSPSFGFEKNPRECEDILKIVNASGANVLVVGVGAPKQEKWIMKYKGKMPNIDMFMALGATIDFEAGNVRRAPALMQKLYLEWLFRLFAEPRRLWKRYLVEDLEFFALVLKQKFNFYKNPFS